MADAFFSNNGSGPVKVSLYATSWTGSYSGNRGTEGSVIIPGVSGTPLLVSGSCRGYHSSSSSYSPWYSFSGQDASIEVETSAIYTCTLECAYTSATNTLYYKCSWSENRSLEINITLTIISMVF